MSSERRIGFPLVFGRFVRNAREALGYSQSQLARLIGRKPHSVNEWETGLYLPGTDSVARLLAVFGLDGVGAAGRIAEAAKDINGDREKALLADVSDSQGRGVGDLRLVPGVVEPAPDAPPRRRGRPRKPKP